LEECIERYGKPSEGPMKSDVDDAAKDYDFEKAGLLMVITFFNGKAAAIHFSKDGRLKFSYQEIEILLEANAGSSTWEETSRRDGRTTYETRSGQRKAFVISNSKGTPNAILEIASSEWDQKVDTKIHKDLRKEAEKLEGF
jgi:hypothetical protein